MPKHFGQLLAVSWQADRTVIQWRWTVITGNRRPPLRWTSVGTRPCHGVACRSDQATQLERGSEHRREKVERLSGLF